MPRSTAPRSRLILNHRLLESSSNRPHPATRNRFRHWRRSNASTHRNVFLMRSRAIGSCRLATLTMISWFCPIVVRRRCASEWQLRRAQRSVPRPGLSPARSSWKFSDGSRPVQLECASNLARTIRSPPADRADKQEYSKCLGPQRGD